MFYSAKNVWTGIYKVRFVIFESLLYFKSYWGQMEHHESDQKSIQAAYKG